MLGPMSILEHITLLEFQMALLLELVMHLKVEGLWSGLVAGATVQAFLLALITCLTNWEKQAMEAKWRTFDWNFPAQSVRMMKLNTCSDRFNRIKLQAALHLYENDASNNHYSYNESRISTKKTSERLCTPRSCKMDE
ncbi:protein DETOXIFICATION 7-like [Olea europaea var. sylvestris]|uniref:protein DETOXIFICATION 7-like n=1 Tax=Olea europaea var. sylvestris TaxID=158386 RepID=UPI000C1D24AC|nr:protein DETOXIFICATION 7-like [Olea europaea var. sylvestris]